MFSFMFWVLVKNNTDVETPTEMFNNMIVCIYSQRYAYIMVQHCQGAFTELTECTDYSKNNTVLM